MLNKLQKKKKRKGFTLVELVIVVLIVAILAGIAVVAFSSMTDAANEATFEANHRSIVSAIVMAVAADDGVVTSATLDKVHGYISNSKGTGASTSTGTGANDNVGGLGGSPKGATYKITLKAATTGTSATPARIELESEFAGKKLKYTS